MVNGTLGFTGIVVCGSDDDSKDNEHDYYIQCSKRIAFNIFQLFYLTERQLREPKEGQSLRDIRVTNGCKIYAAEMPLNKLMSKVHHNQRSKKINLDE